MRSYCSEPERGRRSRKGKRSEQAAIYANWRRVLGQHRKELLRQRGEKVERTFARAYERGAMRRVPLRRHPNILKRPLVHVAAFNLGSVTRKGTPRGFQDHSAGLLAGLAQ